MSVGSRRRLLALRSRAHRRVCTIFVVMGQLGHGAGVGAVWLEGATLNRNRLTFVVAAMHKAVAAMVDVQNGVARLSSQLRARR